MFIDTYCRLLPHRSCGIGREPGWCCFLPFDSDVDLPGGRVEGVEPALHEQSPLKPEGGDEEVEAHSAKAVALQERHEEAKSHKDHHMDILEAWEHTGGVAKRERETKRTERLHAVFH